MLLGVHSAGDAKHTEIKVLILGDSLSAAHNIPVDQGWTQLFSTNIRASFAHTSVINASISGETTFGGLQRLPELLRQHQPSHLIVELGGNDGLRGLQFDQSTDNLRQMVRHADSQGITGVRNAIKDTDPSQRIAILEELEAFGPLALKGGAKALKSDSDPVVQTLARLYLGKRSAVNKAALFEEPELARPLMRNLEGLVTSKAISLAEATQLIQHGLASDDATTREGAILGASSLEIELITSIKPLLNDDYSSVSYIAADYLLSSSHFSGDPQ